MQYPHDTGNTTLLNTNRISEPVKVIRYKDLDQLSESQTVYKDFNGLYLPEKHQTAKGLGLLEDRVVYHDYDDKGNPLEVSKKDDTRVVYIWGYQQTLPIAKIENASYADVSSYVGNLQTLSNADDRSKKARKVLSFFNRLMEQISCRENK